MRLDRYLFLHQKARSRSHSRQLIENGQVEILRGRHLAGGGPP